MGCENYKILYESPIILFTMLMYFLVFLCGLCVLCASAVK
jgi:hypothetical protein